VTTGVIDKYLAGEDACDPSTMTNGQARLPELTLKRSGIYSRSTLTCPLLSSGERWTKLARRFSLERSALFGQLQKSSATRIMAGAAVVPHEIALVLLQAAPFVQS